MGHRLAAQIACPMLMLMSLSLSCGAAKRRFTVADDIGLSHFGDPYGGEVAAVTFSADRSYVVIVTERGLLKENRPESTLWVYRVSDIQWFLGHDQETREVAPLWKFSRSTYRNGPIVTSLRWLSDSTGFAFLSKTETGSNQLVLASLRTRTENVLTPVDQDVTAFSIRGPNNFVYTALSPAIRQRALRESHSSNIVGTGRDLYSLLVPADLSMTTIYADLNELWAVVDGKRARVVDKFDRPIPLHSEGAKVLALSRDGRYLVTGVGVSTVPHEWEVIYPPSTSSDPNRIKSGVQDLETFEGHNLVSEYVSIDLLTGKIKSLVNAPMAENAGWSSSGDVAADWSSDGRFVVLTNTFLPPSTKNLDTQLNRPCLAVVDLSKDSVSCLERLKGEAKTASGFEDGFRSIRDARFADEGDRLTVEYAVVDERSHEWSQEVTRYMRSDNGAWVAAPLDTSEEVPITVEVRESMNEPPALVAIDRTSKVPRVILDPNPQLKDIDLAEVSVFKWRDKNGREWAGGLYKPPDYLKHRRYPLVIQTHGFVKDAFRPYGSYPTAFAAQELAAVEIVVLQVPDCPITLDRDEGPQCVTAYEAAVQQLAAEGIVDHRNVGIIGFSRTCFYVMEALTKSGFAFKAASITDGLNYGYLQYMASVDLFGRSGVEYAEAVIGGRPFGKGLQQWIKQSPEFNLDKVRTPLQVVALGRLSLLSMWEPYAGLRALNKPVDLVLLPDATHVLSNPSDRMISQGGTVDWFSFWLNGKEDPDPARVEQYTRWRELRQLHAR